VATAATALTSVIPQSKNQRVSSPYTQGQAIEYRLWSRVIDNETTGCWRWTGSTDPNGYGAIYWQGRTWKVHRVAWTLCRGAIPDGLTVDHLCRNPSCVNPAHFELVPLSVNQARQINNSSKKTHCPQGHPYDTENTQFSAQGKRLCLTCRRAQSKARNRKRREATAMRQGRNN
jgi:hypothetical protein